MKHSVERVKEQRKRERKKEKEIMEEKLTWAKEEELEMDVKFFRKVNEEK